MVTTRLKSPTTKNVTVHTHIHPSAMEHVNIIKSVTVGEDPQRESGPHTHSFAHPDNTLAGQRTKQRHATDSACLSLIQPSL
mmetsp:Transcript_17835/g.42900  ORF Transcript_17835/g.42900 Transcript_17835/m.42900 type:complete len:82 (+) Transcript_17835:128-373(+)